MSAIRINVPGQSVRLVDIGHGNAVHTKRGIPGGMLVVPDPAIAARLKEKWRSDARRKRARNDAARETPEETLRRWEMSADYAQLIETDAGQALLREVARRAKAARAA